MKKIFKAISLLSLTTMFSFGGFYLGSRNQRMEIVLPARELAIQTEPIEEVPIEDKKDEPIVKKEAPPDTTTKEQIDAPQEDSAPEPETSVS